MSPLIPLFTRLACGNRPSAPCDSWDSIHTDRWADIAPTAQFPGVHGW